MTVQAQDLFASTGNATLDAVAAYSGGATTIEVVEWAVLLGIVLMFTILRTYARASVSGIRGLGWDDGLVWLATLAYIALTVNVYILGVVAGGMANDGVTPDRAIALTQADSSLELSLRTLGSQQQVVKWALYAFVLWTLKGSALHFFSTRIVGEIPGSRSRAWVSACILLATWAGTMAALFSSCQPFSHYWQVIPDPGMLCTAAISPVLIYVVLACNIFTDLYLVSLPVPVFLRAPLRRTQKLSLICLFGCNILISGMTIVRAYFIMKDPWTNGDGKWDLRECYMSLLLTSLPATAPLLRKWCVPRSRDVTEITRSASTCTRNSASSSAYNEKAPRTVSLSGQSQIGVALTDGGSRRTSTVLTVTNPDRLSWQTESGLGLTTERHEEQSRDLEQQPVERVQEAKEFA